MNVLGGTLTFGVALRVRRCGVGSRCTTDRAPVPLREVFDASTQQLRSPVGALRTHDPDFGLRNGTLAERDRMTVIARAVLTLERQR